MAELNTLTLGNNAVELNSTALLSDGNLLSYHRFEGNSLDETANNNDGTDTSITYGTDYGKFTQGALFNGTSSKIALTNEITSSTGTVCFWIKSSASGEGTIYSQGKTSGGDTDRAHITLSSGKINFLVQQSSGVVLSVSTVATFNDGAWHFVALVVGASSNKIYVDGGQQSVTYTTGSASTSKWFGTVSANTDTKDVGVLNIDGTNYNWFSGSLDDLAFFSDELTEAEIKSLGDVSRKAYYRMESGALTTDTSGNGFTLTNVNTVAEATGKYGGGADGGATNSTKYLWINNNLGIDGGACSISLWVKMNTEIGSGTQTFVSQQNTNTDTSFMITYDYNGGTRRIAFRRYRQGVAADENYYTITLGTSAFQHLVLTYDATNLRGYVNGTLQAGPTAFSGNGTGVTSEHLAILTNKGGAGTPSEYVSAIVDDVAIFNRVLTASEVTSLYEATASSSTSLEASLIMF
jgi:hypothetical protein